jgi:hypothetical protein
VDAAGVVADHAADSAVAVAGGIGGEGEVMFFGGSAEVIENDAGLDAGDAAVRIDLEDARHVFREVEDDGDVATLSGEGSASAAAEYRGVEFAAEGECGEDVVGVAGHNYADGDLAIVGSVGRVEGAGAIVEANVSCQSAAKLFVQGFGES